MLFKAKRTEMIYLTNTTNAQPLFIPKNTDATGDLTLTVRSTVGLDTPVDVEVLDLNTSDLYYRVGVTLPEGIANGEYEYTLEDESTTISTGVLIVGDYTTTRTQKNIPVTYEQYEIE